MVLWDADAPGHASGDGGVDDDGASGLGPGAPPGAPLAKYDAHIAAAWAVAWCDAGWEKGATVAPLKALSVSLEALSCPYSGFTSSYSVGIPSVLISPQGLVR